MASVIRALEDHYNLSADQQTIWVTVRGPDGLPARAAVARDEAATVAIVGHWHRRDVPEFVPTAVASEPTVHAFVNDGRWLVQCPLCNGAQTTSSEDRRFFCIDCLNAHVQGAWLRVVWPEQRADIEAALAARPLPHTRSWLPSESVADLHRQTAEHGV